MRSWCAIADAVSKLARRNLSEGCSRRGRQMTDASLDEVEWAEVDSAESSETRGVNRLGYRGWSGQLESGWMRWTVISSVGIRRAWQSRWLRRMLFFAWLPAVWF